MKTLSIPSFVDTHPLVGTGQQLKRQLSGSISLPSFGAAAAEDHHSRHQMDMSGMDMSGMNMSTMAPAASQASSTPSTSGMGDSSENMMMMMQMYFYASTKVTLWFHSWSISSRGE